MNIVFQASAGTGKTYQVTHLYVSLLLGRRYKMCGDDGAPCILHEPEEGKPIDPRRILLMTYTENAAAELRTRVTQLVLKARHEAEEKRDTTEIEQTIRVLRALPSAPISTIHSFCAGLLRERALDAGISPSFIVMDQDEAEELLEQTAREELLARLNPDSNETEDIADADFRAFCETVRVMGGTYGSSVVQTVCNLLRQADSKGIDLAAAESLLPPKTHTATSAAILSILDGLKRAKAERGGELPGKANEVFQTLENISRDFPEIGKKAEYDDFLEAVASAGLSSFSGKGDLTTLSRELKALVEKINVVIHYRRHYDQIRAFARYAAFVAKKYSERKLQLGMLDFDDLLLRTRDLLRKRPECIQPFEYIIMDEVQDTSRIQCEIVERLWNPRSTRLVICGDAKQAIYAWRNADPQVMRDLSDRIATIPAHRHVALRTSYRSKDLLLDFVNLLFTRVYGETYTRDDRLAPAESKNACVRKQAETPVVEMLIPDWEMDTDDSGAEGESGYDNNIPSAEERVKHEMEAIAARIQLLVSGSADWSPRFRYSDASEKFDATNTSNAFRYSDILILLRRTTNQQILEHVLRRHGIPYRISGRGKGLFSRQETKDVLLFFRVLLHPFDSISLIGFLRSPWVSLSDEAILQLGWEKTSFSESRLRANVLTSPPAILPDIDADQLQRLARARDLILRYRRRLDTHLPSELLRSIIAETGYDAVLSGTFRGTQRLANLRKLIDWLRTAERGGKILTADICALLRKHAESPPEIPEAVLLDPDQNAVTIMTVHGAKGLTSRVVFVPDIAGTPLSDSGWAMLDTQPESASDPMLHVRTEDILRERVFTPGFEEARRRMKDIRDNESLNLFYVAMTRARDLVVLSGAKGSRTGSNTWRSAMDSLVLEEASASELIRKKTYAELADALVTLGLAEEVPGITVRPLLEAFAHASVFWPKQSTHPRTLRYPATLLSGHQAIPLEPTTAETERDADTGTAAAFGTAGHSVLERLASRSWTGPIQPLLSAAASESELADDQAAALLKRIEMALPEIRKTTRDSKVIGIEWAFTLFTEAQRTRLLVDGTIDLLLEDSASRPVIIDYKFTDENTVELLHRYSLQLNLYREAVRRMTSSASAPQAMLLAIGTESCRAIEIPEDADALLKAVEAARSLSAD
jgi:ATP-dependent helicase/nuclease subunit A